MNWAPHLRVQCPMSLLIVTVVARLYLHALKQDSLPASLPCSFRSQKLQKWFSGKCRTKRYRPARLFIISWDSELSWCRKALVTEWPDVQVRAEREASYIATQFVWLQDNYVNLLYKPRLALHRAQLDTFHSCAKAMAAAVEKGLKFLWAQHAAWKDAKLSSLVVGKGYKIDLGTICVFNQGTCDH